MHFQSAHPDQRSSNHLSFRLAISLAVCVLGLQGISTAHAQSTVGAIFGFGPAGATVTAHGDNGGHREVTINDDGRYRIRRLRLGKYTVTLERDGKVVDKRLHIPITVGRSAEIDFFCPNDQCAATPEKATSG